MLEKVTFGVDANIPSPARATACLMLFVPACRAACCASACSAAVFATSVPAVVAAVVATGAAAAVVAAGAAAAAPAAPAPARAVLRPAPPYAPRPAMRPLPRSPVRTPSTPPTIKPAVSGLISPPVSGVRTAPMMVGRRLLRKFASTSPVYGFIFRLPPWAKARDWSPLTSSGAMWTSMLSPLRPREASSEATPASGLTCPPLAKLVWPISSPVMGLILASYPPTTSVGLL